MPPDLLQNAIRVFVMGPYTQGDVAQNVAQNVARAIEAADDLFGLGYYPYVPHLSHFWHMHRQRPYLDWMRLDRAWLLQCHAAYRLPGDSPGADDEERVCGQHAIPVFRTIAALREAIPVPW